MLKFLFCVDCADSNEWQAARNALSRFGEWVSREGGEIPAMLDHELGLVFWDVTQPVSELHALQNELAHSSQWLGIIGVHSASTPLTDEQMEAAMDALSSGILRDWMELPTTPTAILAFLTRLQRDEGGMRQVGSRIQSVLEKVEADLAQLDQLQESLRPPPWIQLRGLEVYSRYVPGVKPGGNFFEVLECSGSQRSEDQVLVVLAETSSYGLSAQVTALLLRAVSRWSSEDRTADPVILARRLLNEIYPLMQETDLVGVGVLAMNPMRAELRSVCFGSMEVACLKSSDATAATIVLNQGDAFTKAALRAQKASAQGVIPLVAAETRRLEKDTRVLLASSGFVTALGGPGAVLHSLQDLGGKAASSVLTELSFKLHRDEADAFPERDATAILVDFSPKNHLRVA